MNKIQKQPVITKVEKQRNNLNCYDVYIDHVFICSIHEDILVRYQILKDKVVDEDWINEILVAQERHQAYLSAIRSLSKQSHSTKDLRHKLIKKGYAQQTVDQVIQELKEQNYLNDQKFAEEWTQQRIINNHGIYRIRFDLVQKGISKEFIDQAIAKLSFETEQLSALEIAKKKFKHISGSPMHQKHKLVSYLQRRGFSANSIRNTLKSLEINGIEYDDIDE